MPERNFYRAKKRLETTKRVRNAGTRQRSCWILHDNTAYRRDSSLNDTPPQNETPQPHQQRQGKTGEVPGTANARPAGFESGTASLPNDCQTVVAVPDNGTASLPTPIGVAVVAVQSLSPATAPTECPVCGDYLDDRFAVDGRHRSCAEFEAPRR